jgi:hypothetical protein
MEPLLPLTSLILIDQNSKWKCEAHSFQSLSRALCCASCFYVLLHDFAFSVGVLLCIPALDAMST